MSPPFCLTDEQLDTVRMAAARVPAQWRSCFLEAIVDQLAPVDDIMDDHLLAAIAFVHKRIGVAA